MGKNLNELPEFSENNRLHQYRPDLSQPTFEIVEHSSLNDVNGIHCFICDKTSWNPNDVLYEYCGNCNQFHDILKLQLAAGEIKKGSQ